MGSVVFGYGLGDLFYLSMLWGIAMIFLIAFLINRNSSTRLFITNLLFTIPSIWIILTATIWRGDVYSWNGDFFYLPCRTEIQIERNEKQKNEILSMCSMAYHSDFTGTWNGMEMENITGEIKIPQKLKKHLDYPIEKVLIQPAHFNQREDGIETIIHSYNLDTLRINEKYRLEGEICKIVDRKPMIQARIK